MNVTYRGYDCINKVYNKSGNGTIKCLFSPESVVPFFDFVNVIIVTFIIVGFYLFRRKKDG
jgi:hypothetical protein